ncbi:MHS family MFS transporter [Bacillus haikouensis]|uniref:MFS transporter n=1 Tax=Bacillus haikouensis TaxID=1510468 RepID=UPI0015560BA3|nr:MFS transporter [Bacillus haikouensis]NQD64336.1 MHS family MFS transporter [Bacillus haikouensis]
MSNQDAISMKKVTMASFVGALMEWYDFFLYGIAAAVVFNKLFFPNEDPLIGTIASFASFAIGFLARPIGGVIFGHYGDKIGRKKILVITMMLMGVATFLIGVIPTYENIGIWAPILLVFLRIIQGFGLGGEYGGAALLVIEHSPRNKRGFWGGLLQSATSTGLLLATGVFSLVSMLPDEAFFSWGWRIPFLISIILLFVGTFIRLNIQETPAFQEVKDTGKEAKLPILELIKTYPKAIFIALGARLGETVSSNLLNAFAIAYVSTQLGLPESVALNAIFVAAAVGIIACPVFGALSDRIGRKPVYLISTLFLVIFSVPYFMLLNTEVTFIIWLAVVLGYVVGPTMMFSVQSVFFTEMFGTNVRYSGLSIAYQVSAALGGFTPLIATSLLAWNDGKPWYVAIYLMIIAIISTIATLMAKETYKKDISEIEKEITLSETSYKVSNINN